MFWWSVAMNQFSIYLCDIAVKGAHKAMCSSIYEWHPYRRMGVMITKSPANRFVKSSDLLQENHQRSALLSHCTGNFQKVGKRFHIRMFSWCQETRSFGIHFGLFSSNRCHVWLSQRCRQSLTPILSLQICSSLSSWAECPIKLAYPEALGVITAIMALCSPCVSKWKWHTTYES